MGKKVTERNPLKNKAKSKALVVKKPRERKPKPSSTKKNPVKKVDLYTIKLRKIEDAIIEKCENDNALLLLDCNGQMAIILKKYNVTVQGIKNPNGMQPYQEPPKEKTFFHVFILQWDGKPLIGNLVDMGVPITWVETPSEALYAITL
jgi:hypothetical protein